MGKNVLVLKHFESPKEPGTYFRLVCLTGPNKGESFILSGARVVIGRGDKVDIKIHDTKASREHVEITRVGGQWIATDLGSQNGITINEKKVQQMQLSEGDKLIVGQTVFKFAKVEVGAKSKIQKDDLKYDEGGGKSKKSAIPILFLAALVVWMILDSDDSSKKQTKTKSESGNAPQDISSELSQLKKRQANEDKAIKEKLNAIYQRGLREFREGNYFRAIAEFNLALIISPGDAYAEFHLRKTKEKLDKTIEELTIRAQRDEGALKFQSSIVSYCSIIRLLYTVPDDSRYKNAETMIKDLETKMGLEPGETNCLKKSRTDQ